MQTERSFLKFQEFPEKELLEKCVADVTNNVDINPRLGRKMFEKTVSCIAEWGFSARKASDTIIPANFRHRVR